MLFPTGAVDYHAFEGGRWAVGTWFDPCETWGAEVTGLLLVKRSTTFSAQSDARGTPVLGIPFIDAPTGQESVNYASFPGLFAGGMQTTSPAMVWGMEGTFYADCGETTVLGGGPFPLGDCGPTCSPASATSAWMKPSNLTQPSVELAGGFTDFNGAALQTGDLEVFRDAFNARSQFFGGQVGVRSEFDHGPFYAEFTGKVGLGDSHESILVNGVTAAVPAATGVHAGRSPAASWPRRRTPAGKSAIGSPSSRRSASTPAISLARCCVSSSGTPFCTGATWSAPGTRSIEP